MNFPNDTNPFVGCFLPLNFDLGYPERTEGRDGCERRREKDAGKSEAKKPAVFSHWELDRTAGSRLGRRGEEDE